MVRQVRTSRLFSSSSCAALIRLSWVAASRFVILRGFGLFLPRVRFGALAAAGFGFLFARLDGFFAAMFDQGMARMDKNIVNGFYVGCN